MFGPQADDGQAILLYVGRLRTEALQSTHTFYDFHSHAHGDDPEPFASRSFGLVVKALLKNELVIVADRAFDDARRRSQVEQAFRRTLPGLVVDHVQVGGDADFRGREVEIVFDGDVFEYDGYVSNEAITVESEANEHQLRIALFMAAARIATVGEDGLEHDGRVTRTRDGWRHESDAESEAEIYTPNYISEITTDDSGNPGFYVDCKGAIEPPMAAMFRQVLLEELLKAGITSAHVRVRPR